MSKQEITKAEVFWLVIVLFILHDLLIWGYYVSSRVPVISSSSSSAPSGSSPSSTSSTSSALSPASSQNQEAKSPEGFENLGPVPDLELFDLASGGTKLTSLKGKLVLVDFWGTWCKSCCEELPEMDKVFLKYKDKGLEFIAVAVEFDRTAEKRFLKVKKKVEEMGVSCKIVFGDDSTVKAFGGKLENFPQTYLIDRSGQIRKKIVGARKLDYWDNLIQSGLGL
ncbi:MAG: TlpA family protein disulfide reductase [Candidatus Riflebacteria bacterium]|nr:TlpA family protein disulfide reductase [Candidatus Riflebacteria bacterium]